MRKMLILSDLHLYFGNFRTNVVPDFTVIAGDSCEGGLAKNLYQKMLNKGHKIIFICGNHEYYGNKFADVNDMWSEFDAKNENFHFLNNERRIIEDQAFCGTTLWGHIPPQYEFIALKKLSDFEYIYFSNKRKPITVAEYNSLNNKAVEFLNKNLKRDDILITHHSTTSKGLSSNYIGDGTNYAYFCDISELILERVPKLAINGHVHESFDFKIGETRVVANPRGYVGQSSGFNKQFESDFVIEIPRKINKVLKR